MIEMVKDITIGASKMGDPIKLKISEPPRIGILGASGSGKSCLLLNMILLMARELRDRVQFFAFDPKNSSLLPVKDRLVEIVSDPAQYVSKCQKLEQMLNDRLAYMKRENLTKIPLLSDDYPLVIVIFEELLSFLNNADLTKDQMTYLKSFMLTYMTRARAANLGFILCSHTFSQTETISVAARSQLQQRFILKTGVNELKLMAEGMDELCPAQLISADTPGIFYYSNGDYSVWTKGRTFFNEDDVYEQIARSYSNDVRDIGLDWDVEKFNPFS